MNTEQENATDLLAAGMRCAISTELYKHAQVVVANTNVGGRKEDVMCLVFADSTRTIRHIESRLMTPTPQELAGLAPEAHLAPGVVSLPIGKLA